MGAMKSTRTHKAAGLAIAALFVDLAAAEAPVDFRIIPAGEFRSWDGRPTECAAWVCLPEDGASIVAEINARQSARVIDYEHATLIAKRTGAKAEAAGWFNRAEWRADGVWLIGVKWTAAAAQEIVDTLYRYVSPVFGYDPKTGRVQSLLHAALTNDPGLDGLTDLAALAADIFNQPSKETAMDELLEQLRWLLNLPVGATAEEITAHLQKLIDQIKSGGTAAASFDLVAHLAQQKSKIVELSAQVAHPDPAKFVPVAALSALQGEHAQLQVAFAALSAEVNGGKIDKIVADGLAAGKLTPATEAWARDLGATNLAALTGFLEKAPVIVMPGQTQTGGFVADLSAQSTGAEHAVMKALGLTATEFAAGKLES